MTTPSLPQDDDSKLQAERTRSIAWAQTQYGWMHSHTYEGGQVLEPIAALFVDDEHPLPDSQGLNLVELLSIVVKGLELLDNMVINVTNLFDVGAVEYDAAPPASFEVSAGAKSEGRLAKLRDKITDAVEDVVKDAQDAVQDVKDAVAVKRGVSDAMEALEGVKDLVKTLEEQHVAMMAAKSELHAALAAGGSKRTDASRSLAQRIGESFKTIIEALLEAALSKAGLFGPASSIHDYARQFQTIVIPDIISQTLTDACFARMRVAGPNPLIISKITAIPDNFPVDSGRFEALTGQALSAALASDRVYLVNYKELEDIVPGSFSAGQKYLSPGLALFALSEDRSQLSPVAIQCGQSPGNSTPIFYSDDGESWELAKTHIQSADGNYHELISHLGLTHFLIEPFAVATHRNLAQQHPVYVLLLPHIQGTLFINNAAITSLISPEGTVDRLLAGTIASDWKVTTGALTGLDFNARMLPRQLADRGVDDPALFPDYPYRDDALLVWDAIHGWVRDYLSIYYNNDDAVVADTEIQAWYRDLVSADGGCIKGFGEPGPDGELGLFTFAYLAEAVTMLIFTGSAQHATVNFPQRELMSYTPTMPLATYAPAPTQVSGEGSSEAKLAELPPLQMGLLQQLVGQFLGGIYFTRLGDYDRHQSSAWFTDPKVAEPLAAFQNKLIEVEGAIGTRNLQRTGYEVLLPSRIPQSINI